jgi:peroxiredoxin
MSLEDELSKIRAAAKEDAPLQAAYQDFLSRLDRAETGARALKPGNAIPAFLLPDAEGRLVASDDLLARGSLVINFFRGDWCPYCRQTLKALEAALLEIEAVGGQLVALTPDTGHHLADTKRGQQLSYQVLSDVDGTVGLQFGVLFRAPAAYREVLAGYGINLAERHGNEGGFIPLPATYVVDRGGIVRYAFVNIDFTRRAEPAAVIAALKHIQAEST